MTVSKFRVTRYKQLLLVIFSVFSYSFPLDKFRRGANFSAVPAAAARRHLIELNNMNACQSCCAVTACLQPATGISNGGGASCKAKKFCCAGWGRRGWYLRFSGSRHARLRSALFKTRCSDAYLSDASHRKVNPNSIDRH